MWEALELVSESFTYMREFDHVRTYYVALLSYMQTYVTLRETTCNII